MREEGDRSRDEGGEGARAEPGRGAALVFESKKVSMDVFISLSEDVNAASKASGPAGHAQTGGKSFLNTWASERP